MAVGKGSRSGAHRVPGEHKTLLQGAIPSRSFHLLRQPLRFHLLDVVHSRASFRSSADFPDFASLVCSSLRGPEINPWSSI